VLDALDVENGGVAIGAGLVGALDAPDLVAGGAVEADDVAAAIALGVVVAVDDQVVLVGDGGAGPAVDG
jgi:hypothetical protein